MGKKSFKGDSIMKRTFAYFITLIIALASLLPATAFAANQEFVPYASTYFSSYNAEVIPEGDGDISIEYTVQAKTKMLELGASKVVIQEKSGSTWDDVKTYSKSTTPSLIAENRTIFTKTLSYSGDSNKEYRAIITFYAKNSAGTSTRTYTTDSITA